MNIKDKNRLPHASHPDRTDATQAMDRQTAEWHRFSAGGNVLSEKAFAIPDWRFSRTKTGVVDDADPNTTPPTKILEGAGFSGLNGYLEFTAGTTPAADITLWLYDEVNQLWFEGETKSSVAGRKEIRFAEAIRNRPFWLQFTNITGAPTSFQFRGCGE